MLNRRVGRRSLLARGAVLGLSASALGGLMAACQPAAPPTATTAPKAAAPAPAPAKPTEAPKPAAAATKPAEKPAAAATKPAAAPAATKPAEKPGAAAAPAKRGGGGTLKLLYWQAPTIVNPHLAVGTKDSHASRVVMEPLMTYDESGKLVPLLVNEIPSRQNGGLSEDGKTITFKLKRDVKWADGQPFTAEDVVFTWQYVTNKETASTTIGPFLPIDKVEAVDPLTAKVTYKEPNPGWFVPFSGSTGMILPKHALKDYVGAKAREAPFNLKSFGTGAFMVDSFKPGDLVIYTPNPHYREPSKPFFDRIELKGGGDAPSAARAIFQTGEFDFAWNLQVEWPVLQEIMKGGRGELLTLPGIGVEQIYVNFADPNKEVEGERSSPKSKHPFLTDKRVRQAMALAIDRDTIAKQLYGETGVATPNVLTTPPDMVSKNTKSDFKIDEANKILDDAGYKKGGDGIRTTPDGVRMKVTFVTSINSLRQKEQALVKDGWQKIGIETELGSVDAGVFFASDAGKTDSINHFFRDTQMYTSTFTSPFPLSYMKQWYSGDPSRDLAQKSNNWAGDNRNRWVNEEYNKLYDQATSEMDPQKSAELFRKMNDIVVNEYVSIPLADRKRVDAYSKNLKGPKLVPFDDDIWNIGDWTK